jgi:hypothetical protein
MRLFAAFSLIDLNDFNQLEKFKRTVRISNEEIMGSVGQPGVVVDRLRGGAHGSRRKTGGYTPQIVANKGDAICQKATFERAIGYHPRQGLR